MSSVVLLDKVNVFSFAAGFFFLSAAALSAYLIYQEEDEDEEDVMSECSQKMYCPDKVIESKGNKCPRSLIKKECKKSKLVQDSDSLDDFPSSSGLDSVSDRSETDESDIPNNILVEVQKPCRLWKNEANSSIENSTYEEDNEEDVGINDDLESTSATWETDDEEKNVSDEDEEIETKDKVGKDALVNPNLSETNLSAKEDEDFSDLGNGEVAMLSKCNQIVGEDDNDARDQTSESITKLYQMEEDVKISRLGNQSQHKSEDDQQSVSNASSNHSFLHYNKVTTIGVYGPSQEGEDIEELLKNRSSLSEWIPPGFFNKEEVFEGTGEHEDNARADSGGDVLLEDTDKKSMKQLNPPARSNDDSSGGSTALTGTTSKSHFQHQSRVNGTDNGATSLQRDTGVAKGPKKGDNVLSDNDSLKLTQWLAWEKDILGDAFEMESPLIQDIPVPSALVDETTSNLMTDAKSSLNHGIKPSSVEHTSLKTQTDPNLQYTRQVKSIPGKGNVIPIVSNEEIKHHIKQLDSDMALKEQYKSCLKKDHNYSLQREETRDLSSSTYSKEMPLIKSSLCDSQLSKCEEQSQAERVVTNKKDNQLPVNNEEEQINIERKETSPHYIAKECTEGSPQTNNRDPQIHCEANSLQLQEEVHQFKPRHDPEINNYPEPYVTEEVTFNVLREKIMPHLSEKTCLQFNHEANTDQSKREPYMDQKEEIQDYLNHNVTLPEEAIVTKSKDNFENQTSPGFTQAAVPSKLLVEPYAQVALPCEMISESQDLTDLSEKELHKRKDPSHDQVENVQNQAALESKQTHLNDASDLSPAQPIYMEVGHSTPAPQDKAVDFKAQTILDNDPIKQGVSNPQGQEETNFTALKALNLMERQTEMVNGLSSTTTQSRQSSACTTPRRMSERSVSFDLGKSKHNKLAKDHKRFTKPGQHPSSNRVSYGKTVSGAPVWSNKVYEPKSPGDLEGGFRNRRSEAIVQKKKYVSPYCHPAKLQLIMKHDQNKN